MNKQNSNNNVSRNTDNNNINKNNTEYDAFFDNSSDHPNGSGIGLIISKQFSKHIHKIESFKGRLISADMFFKGHIKMRIIQIYIHANTTQREEIEELYTKITN